MIYIIDFGSQTCHLIERRLRDFCIETCIVDPEDAIGLIHTKKPTGIILSGGPSSVYDAGAPMIDPSLFSLGIPILGICYGWQLTAKVLGGDVAQGQKEYGPTRITSLHPHPFFPKSAGKSMTVWMSHGDEVKHLPKGFTIIASTPKVPAAMVVDEIRRIYGVQFHPEVTHTEHGGEILKYFVGAVCGEKIGTRKIRVTDVITAVKRIVDEKGENSRAIGAVSGGVDSTVAGAIVASALGKRFIPVYCDNGLMRTGTREEVNMIFGKLLHITPTIIDCKNRFLHSLRGITNPEEKRKAIGKTYIDVFEEVARSVKPIDFLVQGTIYSDVIESKGTKHADHIKSHHNVGGLPKDMMLDLLEPLRQFYKDEVRELGRQLGLPESVFMKQPFPGPGAAIRIIGEVTDERLVKQQQADGIVLSVLRETGWYEKVFQSFPILTGLNTTAVKGDGRVYGELVGIRIYDSSDVMTAGWTHLPYDVLQTISSRIVNEVAGISRVCYDITTKPPATMEWE